MVFLSSLQEISSILLELKRVEKQLQGKNRTMLFLYFHSMIEDMNERRNRENKQRHYMYEEDVPPSTIVEDELIVKIYLSEDYFSS